MSSQRYSRDLQDAAVCEREDAAAFRSLDQGKSSKHAITSTVFPMLARHNSFHEFIEQRNCECSVAMIRTPNHAALD